MIDQLLSLLCSLDWKIMRTRSALGRAHTSAKAQQSPLVTIRTNAVVKHTPCSRVWFSPHLTVTSSYCSCNTALGRLLPPPKEALFSFCLFVFFCSKN